MIVPRLQRLRDRYDAILLDLDGTLLDGEARLTPRTVTAVRALADAGLLVMLCTGRSVAGTRAHAETLGLGTPMVTYNGAWIGTPGDDPLHYVPLPDAHLDVLLEVEREASFAFRHRADQKYTVMTEHPEHRLVADWFAGVVRMRGRTEMPARDLMRVNLFFDTREVSAGTVEQRVWNALPPAARDAMRADCFPLSMFPAYADSTLVLFEVQGCSAGKAEALAWLERDRGIDRARTIAVGDHVNDLSMLAEAGLAVVMGNGVPEARDLADVVIGHHAEEGVADWIERGAPFESNGAEPR